MKKRIGAFVGKFYPPHIGHLSVVDGAIDSFDKIYIIISKNNIRNNDIKNQQGFEVLNPELIKSWFEKHYQFEPKVEVRIFDESEFRPYPQDVDKWSEKFKREFPEVNVKIADAGYRDFNKKFFPEYEFYEIDREKIPVHSTMLRNNMKSNLKYLIPEAREYFDNNNPNVNNEQK